MSQPKIKPSPQGITYERIMEINNECKRVLEEAKDVLEQFSENEELIGRLLKNICDPSGDSRFIRQFIVGLQNLVNGFGDIDALQTNLNDCMQSLAELNCFYMGHGKEGNRVRDSFKTMIIKAVGYLEALSKLWNDGQEMERGDIISISNGLYKDLFEPDSEMTTCASNKLQERINDALDLIREYLKPNSAGESSLPTVLNLLEYAQKDFISDHHTKIKPKQEGDVFFVEDQGEMREVRLFTHNEFDHLVIVYNGEDCVYEGLNVHLYEKGTVNAFKIDSENTKISMYDSIDNKIHNIPFETRDTAVASSPVNVASVPENKTDTNKRKRDDDGPAGEEGKVRKETTVGRFFEKSYIPAGELPPKKRPRAPERMF